MFSTLSSLNCGCAFELIDFGNGAWILKTVNVAGVTLSDLEGYADDYFDMLWMSLYMLPGMIDVEVDHGLSCWIQYDDPGSGGGNPVAYYTVSLSVSHAFGGFVTGGGNYQSGSQAFIAATPNSGYQFVNWTGSVTVSTSTYAFTVTGNMSFTANFKDISPCGKLNDKDQIFRDKLADLKIKTASMTLETAYIRAPNGSYSSWVGTEPGRVDYTVTNQISELSHNHNTGLLPIYGITDLYALYELYSKNKMENMTDFNFVLVTPDAAYDLKITDAGQFLNFVYQSLMTTKRMREAEKKLKIDESMSTDKAEKRFLNFISDKGLTLYKSRNSGYTDWGRVQQIDGNIVIVNCNN